MSVMKYFCSPKNLPTCKQLPGLLPSFNNTYIYFKWARVSYFPLINITLINVVVYIEDNVGNCQLWHWHPTHTDLGTVKSKLGRFCYCSSLSRPVHVCKPFIFFGVNRRFRKNSESCIQGFLFLIYFFFQCEVLDEAIQIQIFQ